MPSLPIRSPKNLSFSYTSFRLAQTKYAQTAAHDELDRYILCSYELINLKKDHFKRNLIKFEEDLWKWIRLWINILISSNPNSFNLCKIRMNSSTYSFIILFIWCFFCRYFNILIYTISFTFTKIFMPFNVLKLHLLILDNKFQLNSIIIINEWNDKSKINASSCVACILACIHIWPGIYFKF